MLLFADTGIKDFGVGVDRFIVDVKSMIYLFSSLSPEDNLLMEIFVNKTHPFKF